jgi:hypothetical protein
MSASFLVLSITLLVHAAGRFEAGDEAFFRIEYPAAIESYEAALRDDPADSELHWRLARAYVCLGEVSLQPERGRLFASAERYARRCIEIDSLKPEGHTWLAAALGYLALDEGAARKVQLSAELHREANRAIELNPNDDVAYSILGSFYRALGNIRWLERTIASIFLGPVPEGGYDEAEAALKKAVALAPEVMRHPYELGVLYVDMGRDEEARQTFEAAALLPVRTGIDSPRLLKIREFLSRLTPAHQ